MKLKIRELKPKVYTEWHKWFAWYPVCVGSENKYLIYIWLKFVRRKKLYIIQDYAHMEDSCEKWIYEEIIR